MIPAVGTDEWDGYVAWLARSKPSAPLPAASAPPTALDPAPPAAWAPVRLHPSIRGIVNEVTAAHNVSVDAVIGTARTRKILNCRAELYYRLVTETGVSYPRLGEWLHRHHTTIMSGARAYARRSGLAIPRRILIPYKLAVALALS